jgi:hypothetical protein
VYQEGTPVKPLKGKEEAILKSKKLAKKFKRELSASAFT